MLAFFLADDLIKETIIEIRDNQVMKSIDGHEEFTATIVKKSDYLEGYFHSMLTYFRGINRPPDNILVLKLKELLINLINSDPLLTSYFINLCVCDKPSIHQVMEKNYCFNLHLEEFAELCHRSLSSFKREFQQIYGETPGKWIIKRRVKHAANLIANTNQNITQIAFETGFEDLSHFSRVFKQIIGEPPTEYKKKVHI